MIEDNFHIYYLDLVLGDTIRVTNTDKMIQGFFGACTGNCIYVHRDSKNYTNINVFDNKSCQRVRLVLFEKFKGNAFLDD